MTFKKNNRKIISTLFVCITTTLFIQQSWALKTQYSESVSIGDKKTLNRTGQVNLKVQNKNNIKKSHKSKLQTNNLDKKLNEINAQLQNDSIQITNSPKQDTNVNNIANTNIETNFHQNSKKEEKNINQQNKNNLAVNEQSDEVKSLYTGKDLDAENRYIHSLYEKDDPKVVESEKKELYAIAKNTLTVRAYNEYQAVFNSVSNAQTDEEVDEISKKIVHSLVNLKKVYEHDLNQYEQVHIQTASVGYLYKLMLDDYKSAIKAIDTLLQTWQESNDESQKHEHNKKEKQNKSSKVHHRIKSPVYNLAQVNVKNSLTDKRNNESKEDTNEDFLSIQATQKLNEYRFLIETDFQKIMNIGHMK